MFCSYFFSRQPVRPIMIILSPAVSDALVFGPVPLHMHAQCLARPPQTTRTWWCGTYFSTSVVRSWMQTCQVASSLSLLPQSCCCSRAHAPAPVTPCTPLFLSGDPPLAGLTCIGRRGWVEPRSWPLYFVAVGSFVRSVMLGLASAWVLLPSCPSADGPQSPSCPAAVSTRFAPLAPLFPAHLQRPPSARSSSAVSVRHMQLISIGVSCNTQVEPHRDVFNFRESCRGEIWVAHPPGPHQKPHVMQCNAWSTQLMSRQRDQGHQQS